MLFAPKERNQQQALSANYEQHLLGETHEAAVTAATELKQIDHHDFTETEEAKLHGEWARQALVLGAAAVKKGESPLEALENRIEPESAGLKRIKQDLLIALETANNHYPLAATEAEARKRGDFWQPVYETQSAQIEALRDVLHLTVLLVKIFDDPGIQRLSSGLRELLFKIAEANPKESAALVFLTEEAPYQRAQRAYDEFMAQFGPKSKNYDPNRLMVVGARFLARALSQADFQQFGACLHDVLAIHHRNTANPSLSSEQVEQELSKIKRQLLTNLTRPFQALALAPQYANLRTKLTAADQAIPLALHQLSKVNYVGLGDGRVEEIGKSYN